MDVNQAALMQLQIKNNAADLDDYLKGLASWEDEIKEKDKNLSEQKSILKEQLPPVRSHAVKEHKRKRRKMVEKKPKKPGKARISSYDYRSWDKFDVDKACEEVDYQVQSSPSSYESSTDEEGEVIRKKQQAIMEKEKGNEYFKKCAYELAVESYAKAMELDSSNAVLPANRAMALLKLERYAAAEEDCSCALALDGTYVKAYLRRATARKKLKKFLDARQDFESVLQIEPGNKLALTELEKLDKEVGTSGLRYIRAVKRPPHLRSKKPLKRVSIEDIASTAPAKPSQPSGIPANSANPVTSLPLSTSISASSSSSSSSSSSTTSVDPALNRIIEVEEAKKLGKEMEGSAVRANGVGGILHDEVEAAIDGSGRTTKIEVKQVATGSTKSRGVADEGEGVKSGAMIIDPKVELPPVPTTSVQFQADWRNLKRDRNLLSQYFKAIPVSSYPVLLQQSLETDIFQDILSILHQDFVKCGVPCTDCLSALTKVQRFSVAVMFLSKQQKQCLQSLFRDLLDLVEDVGEKSQVSSLAREFSITNV